MIDAIYEAATDEEAYARLPARLAATVGARSATLQIVEGGAPVHVATSYFTPAMGDYYVANNIGEYDVWNDMVLDRALMGRALTSDTLLSRADFSRTAFYNEFFRSFGDDTGVSLGALIKTDRGFIGLGLHRALTAKAYDDGEIARLGDAIPHLKRMIDIRSRLGGAAKHAGDLASALDAHSHGIILTDHTGRVTFANQLAETLLAAGDALRMREGRLVARESSSQTSLEAAIHSAGRGAAGGALWARRADGSGCRLVVSPHRTSGELIGALILIDDPARPLVDFRASLRALYGLTAAEADLARRLFEGLSPQEAANARGVALSTIQSQLKSIRARTGIRRQSELATLIASLLPLTPAR
ncbi:MAG: hypothetical protein KJ824_09495 [Alphaproteobacteria bacterium]|nr:hypothetical protein [Alphaproteobacteria bacterium]